MKINENLLTLYDKAKELPEKGSSLKDQIELVDLRYISSDPAGEGGMKKILRTKDEVTGREVAMAVISEEEPTRTTIENFLREARITAALQHPNIVPVYDIGINDDDMPYFTMKLLEGEPLDIFLKKKPPLPELVEIFKKICDGTAYAHSRGIIHLDLKPANIYIGRFGDVIICDWGLARLVNSDENDSLIIDDDSLDAAEVTHMTLNGELKGTPGFMAPEQARPKSFKDQRTDIFTLGALLYSMLTGKVPFEGKTVEEVCDKTLKDDPIPPSKATDRVIPPSLEAICMKAMAKSPVDRYSSVEEIIQEIDNYQAGFATEAENAGTIRQLQLLYKRHRLLSLAIAAVLTVALTATIIYIKQQKENLVVVKEKEQIAVDNLNKFKAEREEKLRIGFDAAKSYFENAQKYWTEDNYTPALKEVTKALKYDPDHTESNSLMGKLLLARWNFKEARKYLLKGTAYQNKFFIPICNDFGPKINPETGMLNNDDFLKLVARTPVANTVVKFMYHDILKKKMPIEEKVRMVKAILQIRNPLQREISFNYDH